MDEEEPLLETQLGLLASRVAAIEQRLARLEAQGPVAGGRPAGGPAEASGIADEELLAGFGMPDIGSLVALLGRTLFVLAGAFLLRALTDSGQLAAGPGVLL